MFQAISKVLFWTYSRGSWQYDIVCALILCFIFLTPRAVFDGSAFRSVRTERGEIQRTRPDGAAEPASAKVGGGSPATDGPGSGADSP